jgi:hypothetical protein
LWSYTLAALAGDFTLPDRTGGRRRACALCGPARTRRLDVDALKKGLHLVARFPLAFFMRRHDRFFEKNDRSVLLSELNQSFAE